MDHEPDSPAPRARRLSGQRTPVTPAPEPQLTPAQKSARTKRIRRAARECEARIAAAEAEAALLPQAVPAPPPGPDAHGFHPAEYRWVPVRRKPRKDGWTPERQQRFIAELADRGCVEAALTEVQMSTASAYRLRRSPGAESFARAWDLALEHAARKLVDVAFDRALRGTDEPVFGPEGQVVGRRFRQNDRLMMFLLRAYMPERFRQAHRDRRALDETVLPPPAPLDQALARLAPVRPESPAALMDAEEREDAKLIADMLPAGQLPNWAESVPDCAPAMTAEDIARNAHMDKLIHGDAPGHYSPEHMVTGGPTPWAPLPEI